MVAPGAKARFAGWLKLRVAVFAAHFAGWLCSGLGFAVAISEIWRGAVIFFF